MAKVEILKKIRGILEFRGYNLSNLETLARIVFEEKTEYDISCFVILGLLYTAQRMLLLRYRRTNSAVFKVKVLQTICPGSSYGPSNNSGIFNNAHTF